MHSYLFRFALCGGGRGGHGEMNLARIILNIVAVFVVCHIPRWDIRTLTRLWPYFVWWKRSGARTNKIPVTSALLFSKLFLLHKIIILVTIIKHRLCKKGAQNNMDIYSWLQLFVNSFCFYFLTKSLFSSDPSIFDANPNLKCDLFY